MNHWNNQPKLGSRRHNSSLRIKTQFVSSILRETAIEIREAQDKTAEEWDLFESGTLRSWLQGHFSVDADEGGAKLHMRYLNYLRFLDLPDPRRKIRLLKREGYHLYNRLVFGVLYNRTLPSLRYGFTDDIRKETGKSLQEAVGGDRNLAALISKSMRRGYGF